jgi:hypothetical protein
MNIIRKLLKGISLTAAMFVFQACYGTNEWNSDTDLTFRVVSAEDGSPLPHVKIRSQLQCGDSAQDWYLLGYTNDEGICSVWVANNYSGNTQTLFRFVADDPAYAVKDTLFNGYINRDTVNIALSKVDNAQ